MGKIYFAQNFHWAILVIDHTCSFYKKNKQNPMTGFGENGQNGRFWAKMGYLLQFLPRNGENVIFLGKSKNVTSVPLLCCNFVQETKTNLWTDRLKMAKGLGFHYFCIFKLHLWYFFIITQWKFWQKSFWPFFGLFLSKFVRLTPKWTFWPISPNLLMGLC